LPVQDCVATALSFISVIFQVTKRQQVLETDSDLNKYKTLAT